MGILDLQDMVDVVFPCALGHNEALDIHPGEEKTPQACRYAELVAILHMSQAPISKLTVLVVGEVAISNVLQASDLVATGDFYLRAAQQEALSFQVSRGFCYHF